MIAVADSSPLILLSKLGHLNLLRQIFAKILISEEVHHEVVVAGKGLPGATEVETSSWLDVRAVSRPDATRLAMSGLGTGEASAIALALAVGADVILLDDYRARAAAKAEGVKVIGTIGLLEEFFRRGLIADLRAVFKALAENAAYVDKRLLDRRLRFMGLTEL